MNTRDLDWLHFRLRELVPELASGDVEIKGIAREMGVCCLIAVAARTDEADALGAMVGPSGSRIKKLVRELNGEQVIVVKWSDREDELIRNLLAPLRVRRVALDAIGRRAAVDFSQTEFSPRSPEQIARQMRLTGQLTDWQLVFREV